MKRIGDVAKSVGSSCVCLNFQLLFLMFHGRAVVISHFIVIISSSEDYQKTFVHERVVITREVAVITEADRNKLGRWSIWNFIVLAL